jgi:hypothetical protein
MFPLYKVIITLLIALASINTMKTFKTFLIENSEETTKPSDDYHQRFHSNLQKEFKNEYDTILAAAKRNNIPDTDYDNLSMLYAIRRAENGRMGREFGVLSPKAMQQKGDTPQTTLDRQAGWAASSILANRKRYDASDKSQSFETFMGNKWAPQGVANDPNNLNKNWATNVTKFKTGFLECKNGVCTPSTKPTENSETKPASTAPVSTATKKVKKQ